MTKNGFVAGVTLKYPPEIFILLYLIIITFYNIIFMILHLLFFAIYARHFIMS